MNHNHKGGCCHGSGSHHHTEQDHQDHDHHDHHDHDEHNHAHGHGCCGGGCCASRKSAAPLSAEETEFLIQLAQTPYLPLTRFVLKSTKSNHFESVALAPVHLKDKTDSMEVVKSTGAVLKSLEERGFLTLDYEEPLENGNYSEYENSDLYAYFKETVAQAENHDDYLYDIPELELGSIALTYSGQQAIIKMDQKA
ncbi:hypothetical protein FRZ06_04515 [Anoxybacterium hadale]|uniref:Uncharacterized protein n=1 Tax=Anoxybacterium hadale TaxID=3408580 RepID=A0ACD1A8H3_9FIRM|nr:hypothetical protein FRZ06_04515 [Clostridiales bacterium]